ASRERPHLDDAKAREEITDELATAEVGTSRAPITLELEERSIGDEPKAVRPGFEAEAARHVELIIEEPVRSDARRRALSGDRRSAVHAKREPSVGLELEEELRALFVFQLPLVFQLP